MGSKNKKIIGLSLLIACVAVGAYFVYSPSHQTNDAPSAAQLDTNDELSSLEAEMQKQDQENLDALEDSNPFADPKTEKKNQDQAQKQGIGTKIKSLFGLGKKSDSNEPSKAGIALEDKPNKATPEKKQIAKIKEGCYKVTYKRKKSKNLSWEEYAKVQNVISLDDAHISPKSVCVRVNGIPVKHRLAKSPKSLEVVIHGQAGPNAEITTSYCVGKVTCMEKCNVPKDEFMTALGIDEPELNQKIEYVAWGEDSKKKKKGPSKNEKNLDKEYRAFAKEMNKALTKHGPIFKGWKKKNKNLACPKGKKNKSIQKVRSGEQANLIVFKKRG